MMQRSKYSLNGVYQCEDFAQHVENGSFPITGIGEASGIHWYIKFRKKIRDGSTVAAPIIYHRDEPETQVRAYFAFLKKDGSSCWKKEFEHIYMGSNEVCFGKYVDIVELLDGDNGYLYEGAITVEYGFQVDSEEWGDGIWRFNIHDEYYNWQNKDYMFDFILRPESYYFGHKQIVKLHSKKISDSNKDWVRMPKSVSPHYIELCLQITHGVRFQLTADELKVTTKIAFHFGFTNTVRYCEQRLIEMNEKPSLKISNFKRAVKYNMERYLNHLIKQIQSPERLMSILKRLDIDKMSSESMKTFFRKYLDLIE